MEDLYHLILFSRDGSHPRLVNEVPRRQAIRVAAEYTNSSNRNHWVGWVHVSYLPAAELLKLRRIPLDGCSH